MTKRKSYEDVTISHEKVTKLSDVFKDDCTLGESSGKSKHNNTKCRFSVENLLRSGVKLDHKCILQETVSMLDTFRLCRDEPLFFPAKLADIKTDQDKQIGYLGGYY